jgi:signal transduction histidine kinase
MLVQPDVNSRGLLLHWNVTAAANRRMSLPGHEVRQLALNLLLNAVAAAESTAANEASVELRVSLENASLSIIVSNTGAAMPQEKITRLFEPFVAATTAAGFHRYGLGLWVCWQIVLRLQGAIEVTSDGEWTRISVALPVAMN